MRETQTPRPLLRLLLLRVIRTPAGFALLGVCVTPCRWTWVILFSARQPTLVTDCLRYGLARPPPAVPRHRRCAEHGRALGSCGRAAGLAASSLARARLRPASSFQKKIFTRGAGSRNTLPPFRGSSSVDRARRSQRRGRRFDPGLLHHLASNAKKFKPQPFWFAVFLCRLRPALGCSRPEFRPFVSSDITVM